MVLEADDARLRARGAGHRRGAVDPGPARAARRTQQRPADAAARPVRRRDSRLPVATSTCGTTCASSSRRAVGQRVPPDVPRASSCTTCAIREWQDLLGQLRQVAERASASRWTPRPATTPDRRIHRGAARRAALPRRACGTGATARLPRRPRRPVRDLPRLGAVATKPPRWVDGRRAGRDHPAVGRAARADRARVGRAARRRPGQAHATPSRTGDEARGAVVADERVTLYGVPLVAGRRGAVRPDRPGAVPRAVHPARAGRGRLADPPPLLPRQPRAARGGRGARGPRPAAATSSSTTRTLFDFYDARIPADVSLGAPLRPWWKKRRAPDPGPAHLTRADSSCAGEAPPRRGGLPAALDVGPSTPCTSSYAFEPGRRRRRDRRPAGGAAARPRPDEFPWHGPGLREELVTALIRSPPKASAAFGPAPEPRRRGARGPRAGGARAARRSRRGGEPDQRGAGAAPRLRLGRVPDAPAAALRVVDERGRVGEGRDLDALQRAPRPRPCGARCPDEPRT